MDTFPQFIRAMDVLLDICATDTDCAAAVSVFTGDINKLIEGCTTLQSAVLRCFPLTIAALGARGDVDPDVHSWTGSCALVYAGGREGMVAALLDAFPKVIQQLNIPNFNGDTALHVAAAYRCGDNVQKLLDLGANTLLQNKRNRTAEEVARYLHNSSTADLFVKHAAWKASHRCAWMAAVALVVLQNAQYH